MYIRFMSIETTRKIREVYAGITTIFNDKLDEFRHIDTTSAGKTHEFYVALTLALAAIVRGFSL